MEDFDFEAMYDLAAQEVTATPPTEQAYIDTTLPVPDDDPEQSAVFEIKHEVRPVSKEAVLPTPLKEKKLSFNQAVNFQPVTTETGKKKFITKEVVIDKYNKRRIRIELTPSVCQICAFDIAAKNFGDWHHSPTSERPKILEALQKHIEVAHPFTNAPIVDEETIPKRWLGNNKF